LSIKLIALDMDGTLLEEDHIHVSARSIAALRRAAALGVKIVIASGRNLTLIEDAAAAISVVDYAITANGAALNDWKTGECLWQIGIPESQWRAALEVVRAREVPVEIYVDGRAYVTREDLLGAGQLGFPRVFEDYYVTKVELVDDVAAAVAGKAVEKFHIFYVPPEKRGGLMEDLAAVGPLQYANAEPHNLELTAPGADKGEALAFLCGRLGIGAAEVMAFGDGDNDLGMLSWAGRSYAMGNASPGAKRAARYLTASNAEDGVALAIERDVLG
jgi:Cof subfamily protein (haloacid dehalogenase superfamily)